MNRFTLLFTLIALLFTHNNAISATYDVDMLNKRDDGEKMVYSEDILYIDLNDTVNWLTTSPGHNVEFIGAPETADLPKKPSKVNKEFSYTFDVPGVYLYQCSPHAMMAMAGLIQVSDSSNKSEIETAIQKFESAVMIPGVKTRISDLLRKNVK